MKQPETTQPGVEATAPPAPPAVKRHRVRGTISGLLFGLSLGIMFTFAGWLPFEENTLVVFILPGGIAGLLLAWFGPVRKPKASKA